MLKKQLEPPPKAKFEIGDIVTHSDPYHRRGASVGAVELVTEQGWYQICWEDCDVQLAPRIRSYEGFELRSIEGAST